MVNEIAKEPEYIFITYDGIIKNYRPYLLKLILNNYKDTYSKFINIDMIANFNDLKLNGLAVQSVYPNILQYLAIRKFNYEKALDQLLEKHDDIYYKSPLLKMGESIFILLQQSFISKIYIYTEDYDKRIHADIQSTYHDMDRIEYITGPFNEVINAIEEKITTYMINDVNIIDELIKLNKISYSNIVIAEYGYNYTVNNKGQVILKCMDIDEKGNEFIFKSATFEPYQEYTITRKLNTNKQ